MYTRWWTQCLEALDALQAHLRNRHVPEPNTLMATILTHMRAIGSRSNGSVMYKLLAEFPVEVRREFERKLLELEKSAVNSPDPQYFLRAALLDYTEVWMVTDTIGDIRWGPVPALLKILRWADPLGPDDEKVAIMMRSLLGQRFDYANSPSAYWTHALSAEALHKYLEIKYPDCFASAWWDAYLNHIIERVSWLKCVIDGLAIVGNLSSHCWKTRSTHPVYCSRRFHRRPVLPHDRLGSLPGLPARHAFSLAPPHAGRAISLRAESHCRHRHHQRTGGNMTHDEFAALVSKLEDQAKRNPAGYRFKVLLLAMLGNAYLGGILLLITALLVAAVASILVLKAIALKIILVTVPFLWLILKAVWIKVAPPQGIEIKRLQAPALFAMIEELRLALRAPPFDHVLITDDFNAGVVQSPTLGMFGGYRNYLLLGLPLMKTLSVNHFKAVLAHEFGHLAKGHGRLSNWIYRQRLRWSRLVEALEATESKGGFLFRKFLHWFAPYFNAYSFPLARANEYEADATSVRLTSPADTAAALTTVNVIGSYLSERYWPQLHGQADEMPQPAFAPYSGIGHRVADDLDEKSIFALLGPAIARQTTLDDTHPALTDRLKAIGQNPHVAVPAPEDSAGRLLGETLRPITEALDRHWQDGIRPAWEEQHRKVKDARRRLADLDARWNSGDGLTVQEAYERASLTESVGAGPEAALDQFRALHARAPDDAVACLNLGARMLARDDDAGRTLVERAMELDGDATGRVCELLRDYCWRRGQKEEARVWHQRLIERTQLEQAAADERRGISEHDDFEHHDLPEDVLQRLRDELRTIPHLEKAYLVRKCLRHLAHHPCYVLGFAAAGRFGFYSKRRVAEVQQAIQQAVRLPGDTFIANVEGENWRLGRKIGTTEGARIL